MTVRRLLMLGLWTALGSPNAGPAASPELSVVEVLPPTDVSPSAVNVFASPVFARGPHVFSVDVERPPDGVEENGTNLRTVVRHGVEGHAGRWTWTSTVLDPGTIDDPYHTQGSIALDRRGFVHVAYNMHNMPWQYAVSTEPLSIQAFSFRGEPVSAEQRRVLKHENRTHFASLGNAAIPGTLVTYPRFAVDRSGELYVTYRFALRPKRAWPQRDLAGSIARYDVPTARWQALGGFVRVTGADAELPAGLREASQPAFAYQPGWTPYLLRLDFDHEGAMHVAWTWREGGPGPDTVRPSYARLDPVSGLATRSDRRPLPLPVAVSAAESIGDSRSSERFVAGISLAADEHGRVHALLQPANQLREIWFRDPGAASWTSLGPAPFGATELVADQTGSLWAFASGPRILRRPVRGRGEWQLAHQEDGWCYPKPFHDPSSRRVFIHLLSCNREQVKVQAFRY
jgi:hypothetical protein